MAYEHESVMVQEVLEFLRPAAGKRYLDGTLGGGGHAARILEQCGPDGQILGLDRDAEAVAAARERLALFPQRVWIRRENFCAARKVLDDMGWSTVDGILLDLGLSLAQIRSPERGFSFQATGRLDMRMDRRQSLDAYQVVNTFPLSQLERIVKEYGEEPEARRIVRAIGVERTRKAIETTRDLADLVLRSVRGGRRRPGRGRDGLHPATRVFQALRIAVNQELENLNRFLEDAYELLVSRGRMVIISFHSLEDRVVKKAFRKWSRECLCPPKAPSCLCGWSRKARVLTARPIRPSLVEIQKNPRARSAKLRGVERL